MIPPLALWLLANGTIEFQPGSRARRAVWHGDVLGEAGATTSLRTTCSGPAAGPPAGKPPRWQAARAHAASQTALPFVV